MAAYYYDNNSEYLGWMDDNGVIYDENDNMYGSVENGFIYNDYGSCLGSVTQSNSYYGGGTCTIWNMRDIMCGSVNANGEIYDIYGNCVGYAIEFDENNRQLSGISDTLTLFGAAAIWLLGA